MYIVVGGDGDKVTLFRLVLRSSLWHNKMVCTLQSTKTYLASLNKSNVCVISFLHMHSVENFLTGLPVTSNWRPCWGSHDYTIAVNCVRNNSVEPGGNCLWLWWWDYFGITILEILRFLSWGGGLVLNTTCHHRRRFHTWGRAVRSRKWHRSYRFQRISPWKLTSE